MSSQLWQKFKYCSFCWWKLELIFFVQGVLATPVSEWWWFRQQGWFYDWPATLSNAHIALDQVVSVDFLILLPILWQQLFEFSCFACHAEMWLSSIHLCFGSSKSFSFVIEIRVFCFASHSSWVKHLLLTRALKVVTKYFGPIVVDDHSIKIDDDTTKQLPVKSNPSVFGRNYCCMFKLK